MKGSIDSAGVGNFSLTHSSVRMFTAYLDESGSKDTPAMVVAGWVASADQWIRFEKDWQVILSDHGIGLFHMRDFAACRGEFESWKGKEERRKSFLSRLVSLIRARVRFGVGNVLILKDYQDVDKKYCLREFAAPYPFCALSCIASIREWAKNAGCLDQTEYVFEEGAIGWGRLVERVQEENLRLPIRRRKKECIPLQAADFIAWEHLKAYRQHVADQLKPFRKPFASLVHIPNNWGIYTRETLERVCKGAGLALRSSFPAPGP